MPGFLYFSPQPTPPSAKDLERLTLAHLDRVGPTRQTTAGPGERPGYLFARPGYPDTQVKFLPDGQVWRQIPGSEAWVGHGREAVPGPAELLRADALDGNSVLLGDGREWLVPVARRWDFDGEIFVRQTLPRETELDAEGRWQAGQVVAGCRRLWEITLQWDAFQRADREGEPSAALSFHDGAMLAVEVLARNYHLAAAEAALLGLITEATVPAVLDALTDEAGLIEAIKKKAAADTTTTSPGGGD